MRITLQHPRRRPEAEEPGSRAPRELGFRVALGARTRDITRAVLRSGGQLVPCAARRARRSDAIAARGVVNPGWVHGRAAFLITSTGAGEEGREEEKTFWFSSLLTPLLLRNAVIEARKTSNSKNFVVPSCRRVVVSAESASRETFHRTG
jgi:hypothetical protein